MKIKTKDGKVLDLKTGQAMRLIQNEGAIALNETQPEKPNVKSKTRSGGAEKDSGSDVSSD